MSNQYFKELLASLDEIAKQDNTGQCLDFAKLSQDEINSIYYNVLVEFLQEWQEKYTARCGEPSSIIADLIKEVNQRISHTPNVVEENNGSCC